MTDMECRNPEHEHAAKDGCTGCARDCEAELTTLNDRYMRLLNGQSQHQRQAEAAARRSAQDHVRAFIRLVLPGLLAESGEVAEVSRTVGRASMADPSWGRTAQAREQLSKLKADGERAVRLWHGRLNAVARQFEDDPREQEIGRLRKVITGHGQMLHRELGIPFDGFTACTCPGCELIRAMDAGMLDLTAGIRGDAA